MFNTSLAREHWQKAFDYFWEGKYRLTIREARLAMKLNPNLARPHWIVGQAYLASEPANREAAIKEFRELVRKEPRWVEGHASLAATLLEQGRLDEGLRSVREVLRRKPNYKWAQVELAKHLLKRNEYREAITVLRARPSLSPSYTVADAYLMLDELLARMGPARRRASRSLGAGP